MLPKLLEDRQKFKFNYNLRNVTDIFLELYKFLKEFLEKFV